MDFDISFFKEEIRSGFQVTEKRKKVWAIELELLERFDKVCRKHGLKYFVGYGTLLGAVRHEGFIPWDDDIDVVMFRDDYERFQLAAEMEFTDPYVFQNTYTAEIVWPFSKIRDSRTTALEPYLCGVGGNFSHGIFMDVFPLDSVRDGKTESFSAVAEMQQLLWLMVTDPEAVLKALGEEVSTSLRNIFLDNIGKDIKERFRLFETFNLSNFGKSKNINLITSEIYNDGFKSVEKEWFQDTVYLPFENITVPAPAEYDKVLTQWYGDYHEFVQGTSDHENIIFDPDIPYREYLVRYTIHK